MIGSRAIRLMLVAALACGAGALRAQQALEIIPLRHATVEQVLPVLQPLLEPGATLSGNRGQLFLRASPGNADDIKRALAVIDRPAKRLQISVRIEDALERERREIGALGTISNRGVRVEVTAEEARRAFGERVDQRVQVLEGSRAAIFTGQSRPERDLASGFDVVPRLAGNSVVLEIYQQRDARHAQQAAASTVRARLGEWVELGSVAGSAASTGGGIGLSGAARSGESRWIWVKVDEVVN